MWKCYPYYAVCRKIGWFDGRFMVCREKDPELLAEDSMLAGSQLRTSEVGYFAI